MNQENRKAGKDLRGRAITQRIIAVAISVHRALGPGFLESIYEEALAVEFALQGIGFVRQKAIPLEDSHFAIGRSYLKATGLQDGLLLNFATVPLTIKRFCRELAAFPKGDDLVL